MKSVLISIKPRWVAKILNGEKTIEIRKTCPAIFKHLHPYEGASLDVYIYCTKSNYLGFISKKHAGKVVAKFTLNKVEMITYDSIYKLFKLNDVLQNSCLNEKELFDYLKGEVGYAWHISNLEHFNEPKELSECDFYVREPKADVPIGKWQHGLLAMKPLTKAPQSWCYVEVE